jgi:hypothetical protein
MDCRHLHVDIQCEFLWRRAFSARCLAVFVFGTLLFAVFTFVMSAYDGTLFALLLATLLLPILANTRSKEAVRQYW